MLTNTTVVKTNHGVMVSRIHHEAGAEDAGEAETYELLKV